MNTPDSTTKSCCDTLLAATGADNYEQFTSVGDEHFKNGIQPKMFHRVSESVAPRMKKGFTPIFLGELRQKGSAVSLWQLRFADGGGDDLLFRMAMAGGKVTGALVTPPFSASTATPRTVLDVISSSLGMPTIS
ncbi:MAG TPA: hypothetical protein VFY06_16165 [Verrucomicrobiae bacterium]|nr:hypothetical protein [Verrucomicrobiae bacterium]